MRQLEELIKNDEGDIYTSIEDLESECSDCSNKINICENNLEGVVDDYETKYPQILMDLTTKNKPFYFESDNNNELTTLTNERNYKKIPDKINNIIMNLLLISNMILKESRC